MINQVLKQKDYQNYEEYIKNRTEQYIFNSIKIETKQKDFKEKRNVKNKNTGEISKIKHNPIQEQQDKYLWFINNSMKLSEELGEDYDCIFLTGSLPSSYHMWKKKDKQLNIKYKSECTFEKGVELIKNCMRTIYKNFKVDRKWEKTYMIKVFEYHHDFTPHTHCLMFVKKEYTEKLVKHIKNTFKFYKMGKQKDIQIMKNMKYGIGYISKYIRKTQNPNNERDFNIMNGWKKTHKIRVFTLPNSFINRYVFKKINTVLKLSKDLKDKNIIDEVLEKCSITITTDKYNYKKEYLNTVVKTQTHKDNIYNVEVKRERIQTLNYQEIENMYEDIYDLDYEDLEMGNFHMISEGVIFVRDYKKEIINYYKITSFIIKKGKKILYDKNDYEVI